MELKLKSESRCYAKLILVIINDNYNDIDDERINLDKISCGTYVLYLIWILFKNLCPHGFFLIILTLL